MELSPSGNSLHNRFSSISNNQTELPAHFRTIKPQCSTRQKSSPYIRPCCKLARVARQNGAPWPGEPKAALNDLLHFEFCKGGPYVKQDNVAAFLFFSQPIMNAGPIFLRVTLGREPQSMYADVLSAPPRPIHYQFQSAIETSPNRIV
jgi:hypothetical protein